MDREFGRLTLAAVLFFAAAGAGRGQVISDFATPVPLKPGSTLVIGFLGGWERWDDPHRGVRRLALKLRSERIPGLYAETVSNHEEKLALALTRKALGGHENGRVDQQGRERVRIVLYGQSLGGGAVVKLARDLEKLGVPVLLTVQVDSVGRSDGVIPRNVAAAANLYQHDGPPIMGRGVIRAADPSRTKILGNFRYSYWFRDVDMSSTTWVRKTLGGAHARMEQDPEVWGQVERFILNAISQ